MKFKKVLNEKIIMDKGVKLGIKNDEVIFAFFYDITNNTLSKTIDEMRDCILNTPEYGKSIRFIADNINKKFIIFRPDCLHYKVAAQLGYEYPKNINVLFGQGIVRDIKNPKITDVEFSVFDEMPRSKEVNNFFNKLIENNKWSWTDKYGDIVDGLFNSIMNDNYWDEQRRRHYEV